MHEFISRQEPFARLIASAASPGESSIPLGSVWELVVKGGWVMVPIAVCSLVALTIAVERFIVTRRGRVAPSQLREAARSLRADPRRLLDRCAADPSPLAAVLSVAVKAQGQPRETRDRLVDESGQREVLRLRKRMRLMSALPQVATMLGLLGTVIGMIRTFSVIAVSGESLGKTERLAQGIYEAWMATAAGIAVAIPALIAFHMLMGRIDTAASSIDEAVGDYLNDDAPSTPPATAPSPLAHDSSGARNGVAPALA